jgi:hypothetical protein
MRTKNYLLILPLFLLKFSLFGQTSPPAMAMPEESNTVLIDKIIEVTQHEKYFTDYCSKKIIAYAQKNNWPATKTKKVISSVQFKYYNSTIYNSYAFYSTLQLKKLIETLSLLNKDPKNKMPMVLTNEMMQHNLDLFVENVIDGKYVTSE